MEEPDGHLGERAREEVLQDWHICPGAVLMDWYNHQEVDQKGEDNRLEAGQKGGDNRRGEAQKDANMTVALGELSIRHEVVRLAERRLEHCAVVQDMSTR